jgi:hypothetical protein
LKSCSDKDHRHLVTRTTIPVIKNDCRWTIHKNALRLEFV